MKRSFAEKLGALRGVYAATWRGLRTLEKNQAQHGRLETEVYDRVRTEWAEELYRLLHLKLEVQGTIAPAGPCLFVANHTSYLDIPVLLAQTGAAFVAKSQVRSWPVFGKSAATIGTVFVKRGSARSRQEVANQIGEAIAKEGKRLVLFPEGTSSLYGKTWRRGAFAIAHAHGFPVQAVRLTYRPLRTCAYIGNDTFLPHLWRLLGEEEIHCSVEFGPVQKIGDPEADRLRLEKWVRQSLARELLRHGEALPPELSDALA